MSALDDASGNLVNTTESLGTWQKEQNNGIPSSSEMECLSSHDPALQKTVEGIYCNATWDSHYCWPPTLAGTTATVNCSEAFRNSEPQYAAHLQGSAFRVCQANGNWLHGNWTNYSQCADSYDEYVDRTIEEATLKDYVRYIVFVGSILSILFLVTAITIFMCFRSIWCDRVTIHIHLKLALTLRYILLFIITEPFIFNRATNYRDEDWVCKLVLLIYLYATLSSVNWMFIQGLYLHGKLTTNVFDKEAPLLLYYLLGWVSPVPLLAVYAYIMESKHPVKCWKGYADMKEIWIILAPILGALLINLILLINILRILLTKGQRSCNSTDAVQFQYFKRAAKATVILSPILGINNLLFIYNPGGVYNKVYVFLNTFFGSTQGIFVALVYCYLSSDVCNAIRRVYRRFLARRTANRRRQEQQRRGINSSTSSGVILEQPFHHLKTKPLPKHSESLSPPSRNAVRSNGAFSSSSSQGERNYHQQNSCTLELYTRSPVMSRFSNDVPSNWRTDLVEEHSRNDAVVPLSELL